MCFSPLLYTLTWKANSKKKKKKKGSFFQYSPRPNSLCHFPFFLSLSPQVYPLFSLFLSCRVWVVFSRFKKSNIIGRAIHGSGWVDFQPNPDSTRRSRVEGRSNLKPTVGKIGRFGFLWRLVLVGSNRLSELKKAPKSEKKVSPESRILPETGKFLPKTGFFFWNMHFFH